MVASFVVSFRFLDPRFHGRCDGGAPEWPPSPLRAFQALVAAAAARHRGGPMPSATTDALAWIERRAEASPPRIIAPQIFPHGAGYRLSVPNNALDLVGKAWARENYSMTNDANPATHRAMKTVRPTRFRDTDTVYFLWSLSVAPTMSELGHIDVLTDLARHVVALGWGVDLVVASAAVMADSDTALLAGERWLPGSAGGRGRRVPVNGTVEALEHRYGAFLDRIHGDVWTPPPPLIRFSVVGYSRPTDIEARACTAFALRDSAYADRFRTFDTLRETVTVSARLRHATHEAAKSSRRAEWQDSEIASFVLGHGEAKGARHTPVGGRRFAYLPLPTIHSGSSMGQRVGGIRRALITTFADDTDGEVAWAERALAGQELIDEQSSRPVAFLEPIGAGDGVVDRYLTSSAEWATVTPVVLPGFDDPDHYRRRLNNGLAPPRQRQLIERLETRIDGLIRKAIHQGGVSKVLADNALISWQKTGFWPGTEHVRHYRVPRHLERFPRFHVRIVWRNTDGQLIDVPGPLCVGGGRFYGLGLFAATSQLQ